MFASEYLGWALSIAATLSALIASADLAVPKPGRDQVANWLKERDEHMWASYFAYLFDSVFGPRHFSLRRVTASAISSLITIFALWV